MNDVAASMIHQPHDTGYKYLLSNAKNFMEFLRGFTDGQWVEQIDEDEIMKSGNFYPLQDLKRQEADLVYRLPLKDGGEVFYVLLELQSSVDFQMPYRLLMYMVGIWRDWYDNIDAAERARKDFRLPAIVPIVLYNGEKKWTAFTRFREILNCQHLFGEHILDFEYILVDVNRYKVSELAELRNIMSLVFMLDQFSVKENPVERLRVVNEILPQIDENQLQMFLNWVERCMPVNVVRDWQKIYCEKNIKEVSEMGGFALYLKDLVEKGYEKGKIDTVKQMLRINLSDEIIVTVSQLSMEEVQRIKDSLASTLEYVSVSEII